VPGNDTGAVFEGEDAASDGEIVRQSAKDAPPKVFEVFEVGFAHFSKQEAFEAGNALAIVGAHLGEQPMGFAAATSAAVADGCWAARIIAKPGGSAGCELAVLQDDACGEEILDLIARTA